MAYGVKYRLEFSDVLGYGKKVEILKKDYTGEILPMIGGANPVSISWQSTNDFYNPIIGSKCQLNLFVTDDVTYDDFYKFDEREYKVIVYYHKTQTDSYSDRVTSQGGNIESIECVSNIIDPTLTLSTSFRRKVLDDGGFFESIDCITEKITDYDVGWAEYWSGFLVVDRYKEKMTTTPFAVSFNAFDGLGTLNNFNSTIGYNDNDEPINKTNIERISEILQNLDLDLEIYIASDIKYRTFGPVTTSNFEDITTLDFGYDELTGEYGLLNAKQQLELLLKQFNLRIFQSYNKWYIVEVTNIFDYYVKDMIYSEVQSEITPTGIIDKISTQLESTNKEYINFRKFNYLGTPSYTERKQVLYSNKSDLRETGNSLTREFLQPASEVHIIGSYLKTKNAFYNSGFEYGKYGFDIYLDSASPQFNITNNGNSFSPSGTRSFTPFGGSGTGMVVDAVVLSNGTIQSVVITNFGQDYLVGDTLSIQSDDIFGANCVFIITGLPFYAEIATDEISFKGRRSMKLTEYAPTTGFTQMFYFETEVFNPQEVKYADFTCKLKYYISLLNSQNTSVSSSFSYSINTVLGSTGYFWDASIRKFSSTFGGVNTITITSPNKWIDLNIALNDTDLNVGSDTTSTIKFTIYNTQCSDTDYNTTYYDNMQILQNKTSADQSDQTFISKLTNVGVNTNIKKVNRIPDQKSGYFRTREANPTILFKPNSIDLMTVLGRNIANDYRNYVTRYTGTFRNLKREPMSIHNKIWFYFSDNEFDPQSTIIDGLTYNVKNSEFKVVSHLPNNDDDTPTTSIVN